MSPEKIVRLSKHEVKKRKAEKKARAQSLKSKKAKESNETRKRRHINRIESQKRIQAELQADQERKLKESKAKSEQRDE